MTKVDIFSGFLGAGKTTLIKKLIEEAYGDEKIVLIENEFGDIGIDRGFLKESGIQINEMNSGCICCTLVGDFAKSLEEVMEEFSPERILIEPSGVGKLSDVIQAVKDLDDERFILNGFTTVVDAKKCKLYMENFGEFFNNQIESAKTIILTHSEAMKEDELGEVIKLVRGKNEKAIIVSTPIEDLEGEHILNTIEGAASIELLVKEVEKDAHEHHEHNHGIGHGHHHDHGDSCCGGNGHGHHHDHGDSCCGGNGHGHHHDHEDEGCKGHSHHHNHHHADEIFDSIGIETNHKFTQETLEEILDSLDFDHTLGQVLRAKGILENEDGSWIHFDLVPGEYEIRVGTPEVIGRVVVIGLDLDKSKIESLFGLN